MVKTMKPFRGIWSDSWRGTSFRSLWWRRLLEEFFRTNSLTQEVRLSFRVSSSHLRIRNEIFLESSRTHFTPSKKTQRVLRNLLFDKARKTREQTLAFPLLLRQWKRREVENIG